MDRSGRAYPVPISRLPSTPGVYRFRDVGGRVLYIGRAVDLRRRVSSYWGDLGDRRRLARMIPRIAGIEAVECASEHEAAWLERNLLERRKPRWNRAVGGQEVPNYLRLRVKAGSASLDIVHRGVEADGGRLFGPFLGGNKVRLALAAIERVYPLAYAADRADGFARDMARIRGVGGTDRERMVDAITAVLERDPAAVRATEAELVGRRLRASEALAFELAAKIQSESDALAWLVAEQRVTDPDGDDLDVCGWADGILVWFEIRAGRMNAWTQTRCDETAARERVAATPEWWSDFARRNAELAACVSS